MHSIQFSKPCEATKRFIRSYAHREARLGPSLLIHPIPARSEHTLDFEFGGPIEIHTLGDGVIRTAETAALIGSQTHRRTQLLVRGNIESFTIFFQPAALNLLFGLPAIEITNADHEAAGVLGCSIVDLRQRLGNCDTFPERVQIAEEFVIRRSSTVPPVDGIESAADAILRTHGTGRIDSLARDAGSSIRNLQRSFQQRVGVSPKLYARIVRFEAALRAKALSQHLSWTTLAHQFGYHDQMHMIHDFQQLSAETPSEILKDLLEVIPGADISGDHRSSARLLL
jgi:AraC-like DNA-binding protein